MRTTEAIACRTKAIRVGGLKGRAIDAALSRAEAHGAAALNVRDVAADLGTGQASLYYHFKNKDELMAALATEGFRRLRNAFETALSDLEGRRPLHGCGDAYLRFARRHPELYRLMYSEAWLAGYPTVREAEAAAFKVFADGIACDEPADGLGADRALALWAFGRGMAALTLTGSETERPRDVSRQIVRGLESLLGRRIHDRTAAPPVRCIAPRPREVGVAEHGSVDAG